MGDDALGQSSPDRDEYGRFLPGHKHRFRPGESGNPGGRPEGADMRAALRRVLAEKIHLDTEDGKVEMHKAEAIIRRVVDALIEAPNDKLLKIVIEQSSGKAPQAITLGLEDHKLDAAPDAVIALVTGEIARALSRSEDADGRDASG